MRIAKHQSTIRCRNMNYPLASHRTEFNHPITSLCYIGIERVLLPRRGDLDQILLKRKAYWIHKLNVDFDLSCFLWMWWF